MFALGGLVIGGASVCQAQHLSGEVSESLALRWSENLSGLPMSPREAAGGLVPPAEVAQPSEPQWALDVSIDQTQKHGASRDVALTWGFGRSLHEPGPRIRLVAGRSLYLYPTDETRTEFVSGRSDQVEVLAGFTALWRRASLTVLGGVAHARSVELGRSSEQATGKAVASVFATPVDGIRLFSSLSYTEASRYTQWLLKWGRVQQGGMFWGPEFKADWRGKSFLEGRAVSERAGLHVSSIPALGGWWTLSLGYLNDRQLGEGAYLGFGFYGTE